jgi:DNA-binding response OmpR family regulator
MPALPHLTAIEARIVTTLAADPGRWHTEQALYRAMWGDPDQGEKLRVYVYRLRRKLGPTVIDTVHRGYRWAGPPAACPCCGRGWETTL